MKRLVLTAAALTGFATSALAGLGPLVGPQELDRALEASSPIVLDIRGEDYAKGHIAGAVSAPYGLFRGPAENPGQQLSEDQLEETFEKLGLSLDRPIVVVHQGANETDFGAAARVYWTLKSSGFGDLAILNGGLSAWQQAGLPVSTDAAEPQPTELDITWSNQWTADTEAVSKVVEGSQSALLLDARPAEFFEGEKAHDAAERPGTLPGAANLVHSSWFGGSKTEIGASGDLAGLKQSLGIDEGEEVVSFCNTGHWAATNWFALSEIEGLENVKLYPGSMVEYSKSGHEMANTPGLIRNLLNQIKAGN